MTRAERIERALVGLLAALGDRQFKGAVLAQASALAREALASPSEPSPGGAPAGPYCVRCHRTEPLHHEPNIYTNFRDPLGHPAPPACEEFQAPPAGLEPATPEVCCRGCGVRLSVTTVRDGNDCGACGRAAPTVEAP